MYHLFGVSEANPVEDFTKEVQPLHHDHREGVPTEYVVWDFSRGQSLKVTQVQLRYPLEHLYIYKEYEYVY